MISGRMIWVALLWASAAVTAADAPATAPSTFPSTNPSASLPIAPLMVSATRSTTAPTTQPASVPDLSQAEVREFLAALSDDDFRKRESAQEKLVRLGDDAAPVIARLLSAATDTEARSRLQAALAQVEENRVTGASIITIHADGASPREVFSTLSRQCHEELRPFPDNLWEQGAWPRVTLHIDRQPFWEVMGQIARETGADLQPFGDGARISRGGGFRLGGPSVNHGPFLIVATQISRSQTITLTQARAAQSDFSLQLMVYAEPKIRVLGHSNAVRLAEAIDDQGNNLVPDGAVPTGFYGGGAGPWNLYAPLKYPAARAGTKIILLRGSTDFIVQTGNYRLEVPDVLAVHEVSQAVNGLTVNIHDLKKAGANYELRVSVTRDPADARWNYMQQNMNQRLKVYNAAGDAMEYRGMSSRANDMTMEFTVTLNGAAGQPAKLVWDIPTASRNVSVPFEFKDLPMPR